MGDFNAVFGFNEKMGHFPLTSACANFKEAVTKSSLCEIDIKGTSFTWARKGL